MDFNEYRNERERLLACLADAENRGDCALEEDVIELLRNLDDEYNVDPAQ